MRIHAALLLASLPLVAVAACSIYDSSLVGTGGSTATSGATTGPESTTSVGSTTGTTTTSSGATTGGAGGDMSTGVGGDTTTGTGGAKPCAGPAECPGADTECKTRTCKAGTCGLDFAADGKALAAQVAKDCLQAVCDGAGATKSIPDDNDKPDDANDCTDDTCVAGAPTFPAKGTGSACTMGGGKKCTAASKCVECVVNGDCMSGVCDPQINKCALAGCGDGVKNGSETDLDCGGTCPKCPTGKACGVGADCVGGACTAGFCAPTCTDGLKNNGESDIDCGGATCNKCGIGSGCAGNTDCGTGNCVGNACFQNHLVINEIDYDQIGADTAEFVEIYNGTGSPVSLTNLALVLIDGSNSSTYLSVSLGAGTLPAGVYLVVGSAAVTVPAPGIKITTAAAIQNGSPDGVALIDTTAAMPTLIDALSYEGSITAASITGLGVASLVEGTPLAAADSNTKNGSLSRLPNGSDTNNAASDWAFSNTPTPGAPNVP